jgi:hypothetical protein
VALLHRFHCPPGCLQCSPRQQFGPPGTPRKLLVDRVESLDSDKHASHSSMRFLGDDPVSGSLRALQSQVGNLALQSGKRTRTTSADGDVVASSQGSLPGDERSGALTSGGPREYRPAADGLPPERLYSYCEDG